MKIRKIRELTNGFATEIEMKLNADEMELITNALSVYNTHEMELLSEFQEKGVEPGSNIGELIGGTLEAAIKLRQEIVKQLGYDPTDG